VALLGVGVYAGTVGNGFVLDDHRAVIENRCVSAQPGVACALASDFWGRPGRAVGRTYRPLAVLTFAADWAWGGGRPAAFHVTNALLHGMATLAVFLLLLALAGSLHRAGAGGEGPSEGGARPAALCAATIFATLGVHTDAVAGIVGRADVLATLLGCAALALHFRPAVLAPRPAPRALLVGLVALLALLSHELALLVPVLALLGDGVLRWGEERTGASRAPRRRRMPWASYAALAAAVAAYLALRLVVMGRLVGPAPDVLNNPAVEASGADRVLFGLSLVHRAMAQLLVPARLSAEYGFAEIVVPAGPGATVLLGAAWAALLGAAAWICRRRAPLVTVGSAFLLAGLALLSNVPVLLPTAYAERLLYLPSLGLAIVAGGAVLAAHARGPRWRSGALVLCGLIAAGNLAVAAVGSGDYRDGVSLYRRATLSCPRSARAHLNLGLALNQLGRHAEAVAPLERALEIRSDLLVAQVELAVAHDLGGRPERAIVLFATAFARAPGDRQTAYNYALFLRRHRRPEEARLLLDRHLQLDPEDTAARRLRDQLGGRRPSPR